ISETHLKVKHTDASVNIDGYVLFRRDRHGRRSGGVAIYLRRSFQSSEWPIPGLDAGLELLWVKAVRGHEVTFVGALYHPPKPIYKAVDLLGHIEAAVARIGDEFSGAHIILAGDLNSLPDNEVIIRTVMSSIVTQPTRGG